MRPTSRDEADFDCDGAVLMKNVVPARWLRVLEQATERDIAELGDVLAFHAMTVRSAGGNLTTDVCRHGYAVRCCGERCTVFAGLGPNRDLRNPALTDGDTLDSAQYPVV